MAIEPPSDIVLDVARNADADRQAAASRRLEALAANRAGTSGTFAATLDNVASPLTRSTTKGGGGVSSLVAGSSSPRPAAQPNRTTKVAQDLEATLLGPFVNEMLPKDASSVYGQGVGGDIWRSMLSDQIAHQLAKAGSLGIARRLFATHPLEKSFAGELQKPLITAQANPSPLSMPIRPPITSFAYFSAARRS